MNLACLLKTKYIEALLAILIILFGVILRIKVYTANLPFWVDEDAFLLDLANVFSGKEPFWSGLKNQYSMPVLNILLFFIYKFFNFSELPMRFIPFISSVISLCVFTVFVKNIIKTPFLFLIPLFFTAVNTNLLFVSQYCKFYSTDFLIFILISIAILNYKYDRQDKKQIIKYSFFALIACLSAISAMFYITGIFTVLLLKILVSKNKTDFKNLLLFSLPSLTFMFFYVFELINRHENMAYLTEYWHNNGSYFPFSKDDVINLFQYHTGININDFTYYSLIICLIFGVFLLLKTCFLLGLILLSPVIIMLLLALFDIYPFKDRLTLYLYPLFIILLFSSADFYKYNQLNKKLIIIPSFCIILLIFSFSRVDFSYLKEIYLNPDYYKMSYAREFYNHLKTQYKTGDLIYSKGRNASLRIYDYNNNIIDFSNDVEEVLPFDKFYQTLDFKRTVHAYFNFSNQNDYEYLKEKADIINTINDNGGIYVKFKKGKDE